MKKQIILTSLITATALAGSPIALASCSKLKVQLNNVEVSKPDDCDAIEFKCNKDEFNNAGFALGDSLNFYFSNGKELIDIPYHDGFYVKHGEYVLVNYSGTDSIVIYRNDRDDAWSQVFGQATSGTVNIKLNQKGKYLDTQTLLNLKFDNDRTGKSDEQWANFNSTNSTESKITDNLIYYGSSPFDDGHNRASDVNILCSRNSITYDLDLNDDDETVSSYLSKEGFAEKHPWVYERCQNHKCSAFGMGVNYQKEFDSVAKLAKTIIEEKQTNPNAKFYIHCLEGKDRTGFVICLLHFLAGTPEKEVRRQYLQTFVNFFNVKVDSEQYNKISDVYFDAAKEELYEANYFKSTDLYECSVNYLKRGGLSDSQILQLKQIITKDYSGQCTVRFVTNSTQTIDPIVVNCGETITIPVITKLGYDLVGWYYDEKLLNKFTGSPINFDITLYAKWAYNGEVSDAEWAAAIDLLISSNENFTANGEYTEISTNNSGESNESTYQFTCKYDKEVSEQASNQGGLPRTYFISKFCNLWWEITKNKQWIGDNASPEMFGNDLFYQSIKQLDLIKSAEEKAKFERQLGAYIYVYQGTEGANDYTIFFSIEFNEDKKITSTNIIFYSINRYSQKSITKQSIATYKNYGQTTITDVPDPSKVDYQTEFPCSYNSETKFTNNFGIRQPKYYLFILDTTKLPENGVKISTIYADYYDIQIKDRSKATTMNSAVLYNNGTKILGTVSVGSDERIAIIPETTIAKDSVAYVIVSFETESEYEAPPEHTIYIQ